MAVDCRVSSRRSPRCSRFLRAARMLFPLCRGLFSSSRGPGRVYRSAPGVSCSPRAAGRARRNRRPSASSPFPAGGQAPGVPLPSPVLDVGVPEPLFPQQRAPLGAVLGKGIEFRQDPRLVGGGERPPLRLPGLAAGHLTIMHRDRGLVGQCHRHSLRSPVSPCLITEVSYVPYVSFESDRQGPRRGLPPAAVAGPASAAMFSGLAGTLRVVPSQAATSSPPAVAHGSRDGSRTPVTRQNSSSSVLSPSLRPGGGQRGRGRHRQPAGLVSGQGPQRLLVRQAREQAQCQREVDSQVRREQPGPPPRHPLPGSRQPGVPLRRRLPRDLAGQSRRHEPGQDPAPAQRPGSGHDSMSSPTRLLAGTERCGNRLS